MYRRKKPALILILSIFCLAILPDAATISAQNINRNKIILLHTNDLHFDFNHREVFEQIVAHFRDTYENVFLLEDGAVVGQSCKVLTIESDGEGQDYWLQITPGIAGGWDPGEFKRFILWD